MSRYCLAEPETCRGCDYSYTEPEVNYWRCTHPERDLAPGCPGHCNSRDMNCPERGDD